MSADWIPGAGLGFLGSIAAWLLSWRINAAQRDGKAEVMQAVSEDRDEGFRQDLRDFRDDMKSAVSEVRSLATNTAKLQASQDVVNQVTARALESITTKLDQHQEKLNDHAATLKLVTELLTREQNKRP